MTQHLNFNKLPRSFYEQHTIEVARRLLGCYLIHQTGEQTEVMRVILRGTIQFLHSWE